MVATWGFIYVVQVGSMEETGDPIVKMGWAGDPEKRFQECRRWVFEPLWLHDFRATRGQEASLHRYLRGPCGDRIGMAHLGRELYRCKSVGTLVRLLREWLGWGKAESNLRGNDDYQNG